VLATDGSGFVPAEAPIPIPSIRPSGARQAASE
jgi:hypothetical protein